MSTEKKIVTGEGGVINGEKEVLSTGDMVIALNKIEAAVTERKTMKKVSHYIYIYIYMI